jgi:hypothetical protein
MGFFYYKNPEFHFTLFSIFFLLVIPLIIIEVIIYFVSLKPSLAKKEKMMYRMIRTGIQTIK